MENVTDFLTKQNREYFENRPIVNDKIDMFRKNKLKLYKNVLAEDFTIRSIAEELLFNMSLKEGYRQK